MLSNEERSILEILPKRPYRKRVTLDPIMSDLIVHIVNNYYSISILNLCLIRKYEFIKCYYHFKYSIKIVFKISQIRIEYRSYELKFGMPRNKNDVINLTIVEDVIDMSLPKETFDVKPL